MKSEDLEETKISSSKKKEIKPVFAKNSIMMIKMSRINISVVGGSFYGLAKQEKGKT